jgi:DNA-binding CsgD family transcriptional regulator
LVRESLDLCDEFAYPMRSWPAKFVQACVLAVCGHSEEAKAAADQMEQWAGSRRAVQVRHYALHVRTLVALSESDFEVAYQFAVAIASPGKFPPFTRQAVWTVMDLVEAAVRTGRRSEATRHVEAAREARLGAVSPRLNMLVLASAGLTAEDDAAAEAWFRLAIAVENSEQWPFDLARVQLYFGERLRRGKNSVRARGHLTDAIEIFDRLGAEPWTSRARLELRACGSPGQSSPRFEGVALTPQQWEIARLAASGLSNKQVGERLGLSPRTVSSHLYQLFPKLGITSRAALRDAIQRIE